ncbi:MAG: zinc ribbon domain-containing protein [Syntrophomonadaceae bacterium]|nr:zinc ribbon domain-containing protein [Syntrophomonadaceae bacterium]
MPIYEYRCEKCGKFEKMQKFSDPILEQCPECGSRAERLISRNVGVVLKGSGFYKNDSQAVKDKARALNKERQKDNQAILDGDVGGFIKQSEETSKKVSEA